jgi:hypothetical protein
MSAAGGYARSAALTAQRRSEIARNASLVRSAAMSPERRSEICRNAANARWRRGWLSKTPPGATA